MSGQKEPYVSQEDRPEVKIDPDTPLSQLRVRDIQVILGSGLLKKHENLEYKIFKHEKFEHKELIKELIHDKPPALEVFKPGPEQVFDPVRMGDPEIRTGLAQLIQLVGGLTKRIEELTDQIKR
jgi:hypothetical protein